MTCLPKLLRECHSAEALVIAYGYSQYIDVLDGTIRDKITTMVGHITKKSGDSIGII